MSDLINKSEVIDLLYKIFDKYRISTDKTSTLGGFGSEVFKRVREMPTAYSVDKVVEEFDKKYNNSLWIKGNEEFSITRNELIEIVKQGDVRKDVE